MFLTMEDFKACECTRKERRRFVCSNGVVQIKKQCVDCGKTGQAEKRQAGDEALPEVQYNLWNEHYTRLYANFQAAKEQEAAAIKQQMQWEYGEYLQTDEWREMRAKVMRRDNYLCQCCLSEKAYAVRHRTYKAKRAGFEAAFWLVSVCDSCHKKLHEIEDFLKYDLKEPKK